MNVPGIEYFESPLLPGKPMFRCQRMSASLQVASCVSMWTAVNGKNLNAEGCQSCRSCPVGAQHAGHADPTHHRFHSLSICARCHRTDLRLIGGNICVGCKNREYEWLKGRNAKGKFPAYHPTLNRRRVTCVVGGRVRVLERERTASTTEVVVEVLRDSPDRVVFGFGKGRVYGG